MPSASLAPSFSFAAAEKSLFILQELKKRFRVHFERCAPFRSMVSTLFPDWANSTTLEDLPFLPVRLFKELELRSIESCDVYKILRSSGTTQSIPSKIYLDKTNAQEQTRVLASVVASFIGKKRLPMLIIDHADLFLNRDALNARAAGVLGFSQFGRQHCYLLNSEMQFCAQTLEEFICKYRNEPILLFGFTSIVWKYFYEPCRAQNIRFDLENSILIHGGGWKNLYEKHISTDTFKRSLSEQFGISRIVNYYGLIEQVGSIFMECEEGYLHVPDYSDVIIRDVYSLKPLSFHQEGLIQVLSCLPSSYPGNSILTEDIGRCEGVDNCPCGRLGKYIHVIGRQSTAEPRGCSDTYTVKGWRTQ